MYMYIQYPCLTFYLSSGGLADSVRLKISVFLKPCFVAKLCDLVVIDALDSRDDLPLSLCGFLFVFTYQLFENCMYFCTEQRQRHWLYDSTSADNRQKPCIVPTLVCLHKLINIGQVSLYKCSKCVFFFCFFLAVPLAVLWNNDLFCPVPNQAVPSVFYWRTDLSIFHFCLNLLFLQYTL